MIRLPATEVGLVMMAFFIIHLFFSDFFAPNTIGIIATSLSVSSYLIILSGVPKILKSKDPSQVNLIVAIAAGFNSTAWMGYAFLTSDIILFIPNIAAMTVTVVQVSLYMWTLGDLDDNHYIMKFIKRVFLGQKTIFK